MTFRWNQPCENRLLCWTETLEEHHAEPPGFRILWDQHQISAQVVEQQLWVPCQASAHVYILHPATRLISSTQQGDTLQHYMYACIEIMLRGFLFPPCKRKVVINGVVRMTDGGSPGLFHAYAGCSGSLLSSLVYPATGSWLSIDMLLLMIIVSWIKEQFVQDTSLFFY